MATSPRPRSKGVAVTIPSALSIKDLITIISVTVSLTVAWGVFSTRIALLEQEIVSMNETVKKLQDSNSAAQQQIRKLEARQQDDEMILDQLHILLKRPPPIRRSTQ